MAENMRESSRRQWASRQTVEEINAGSLQRIADACESMAKNHDQLVRERDFYQRQYKEQLAIESALYRKNSALRGVITKLQRRIAELEQAGDA